MKFEMFQLDQVVPIRLGIDMILIGEEDTVAHFVLFVHKQLPLDLPEMVNNECHFRLASQDMINSVDTDLEQISKYQSGYYWFIGSIDFEDIHETNPDVVVLYAVTLILGQKAPRLGIKIDLISGQERDEHGETRKIRFTLDPKWWLCEIDQLFTIVEQFALNTRKWKGGVQAEVLAQYNYDQLKQDEEVVMRSFFQLVSTQIEQGLGL